MAEDWILEYAGGVADDSEENLGPSAFISMQSQFTILVNVWALAGLCDVQSEKKTVK